MNVFIKIIGEYILLCNYFALSHIESIFAIEAPWYDRHQSHTSCYANSVAMTTRVRHPLFICLKPY